MEILKIDKINKIFIWCTALVMLPFPIACFGILCATLLLLTQYNFIKLLRQKKVHLVIHLIFLLSGLASAIYQNWVGLGVTIALYVMYVFTVYYSTFITHQTFEKSVKLMLQFSIVHGVIGILENLEVIPNIDFRFISDNIIFIDENRAASFFLHPNYYATMCGFFILLAWYKIYLTKQKRGLLFYSVAIIVNLGGLLATQTRTAWPVIFVSFIIFMIAIGRRMMRFYVSGLLALTTAVLPFYQNLPRFDFSTMLSDLTIRLEIWQVSLDHLSGHWLIGTGPLTYITICEKYHSYPTQHSHNIFLDILMSVGVLGFILCVPIFKQIIKRLKEIDLNEHRELFALCVSFLSLVSIYSLIDETILWVQTLYVFVIVLLAPHNILKEDKYLTQTAK